MRLVMMAGLPGAGKSTLAVGLADALGGRAFLFGEEKLFELEEFADVARGFRTKVFPDTTMMLDAYARFIARARPDHDTIVFDWSCVGMIEDLPCAQPDRTSSTTHRPTMRADAAVLRTHAANVARLADRSLLMVLNAPTATALGRALAERGEQWFNPWLEEVDELRRGGSFVEGAVRYWETTAPRRDDIVAAHAAAGWDVVTMDAAQAPHHVLRDALRALLP